jgi:hypothetical protein
MDYEQPFDDVPVAGTQRGYMSNDGQQVTEADAEALAAALRKVIANIGDPRVSEKLDLGDPTDRSGLPIDLVGRFIDYASKGSFRIH